MKSIALARFLPHVVVAICMFGTVSAGRNYFLFSIAIVPTIQALRPSGQDRVVEVIQGLLPASGPDGSARSLVTSIASERDSFFQSW